MSMSHGEQDTNSRVAVKGGYLKATRRCMRHVPDSCRYFIMDLYCTCRVCLLYKLDTQLRAAQNRGSQSANTTSKSWPDLWRSEALRIAATHF
jgi:hypothetical protein